MIAAAALFAAAAPVVSIQDTGNVYVDGANVGAPADAIANNPALASPIQAALVSFVTTTKADADAAVAAAHAAIAETLAAKDAQIAALTADKAALEGTVAARDAQLAASATYIATLQALVTSLGGTVPQP